MSTINHNQTVAYVAQAHLLRQQYIAQALRSFFSQPLFAKIAANRREEQKIRKAVRELSMLSDRELSDLGIARVDIENIIRCRGEFAKQNESPVMQIDAVAPKATRTNKIDREEGLPLAA